MGLIGIRACLVCNAFTSIEFVYCIDFVVSFEICSLDGGLICVMQMITVVSKLSVLQIGAYEGKLQ
jgi:hypothetical protein